MLKKIFKLLSLSVIFFSIIYPSYSSAEYIRGRNMLTDFALISTIVGNPSFIRDASGADYYESRRESAESENCIFSHKSHFYWKKDGIVFDSYKMNWQRKGSANLCQTYALLGYKDETNNLRPGSDSYLSNAKVALHYWTNHAELILAYWDGVVEVMVENSSEYPDEARAFSACKKPTLLKLKDMIHMMASSEENLMHLLTTEEFE